MTKPTITHLTAADGSPITITSRVEDGELRVKLYRGSGSAAVLATECQWMAKTQPAALPESRTTG